MRKRALLITVCAAAVMGVLAGLLYSYPPIHERLAWRVANLRAQVQRVLRPPEENVFVPQGLNPGPGTISGPADNPTQTSEPALPTIPATPAPSGALLPTAALAPTSTLTVSALPAQVALDGIRHEYQQFNNCGPATLAMALSYWDWIGDQLVTRAALRPNFAQVDDKNVNPGEMVSFVEQETGLKALTRVGGDRELVKRLVAAGFPVLIEIGIQHKPKDWMGHYLLISGYDDERGYFITQDALSGPDLPLDYAALQPGWRAFNSAYLVIYPGEREAEVAALLGEQYDARANLASAAQTAQAEVDLLVGRDQFFAWFNLGSSLAGLGDYPGAAQAYDRAFAVYPTIPEDDRPWRMLWYQAGPYAAYFNTGRYGDLLTLGNQTLDSAGGPLLEESFYWLGRAREATGNMEKALYDFRKALEINPYSTPALSELERLGQLPIESEN